MCQGLVWPALGTQRRMRKAVTYALNNKLDDQINDPCGITSGDDDWVSAFEDGTVLEGGQSFSVPCCMT